VKVVFPQFFVRFCFIRPSRGLQKYGTYKNLGAMVTAGLLKDLGRNPHAEVWTDCPHQANLHVIYKFQDTVIKFSGRLRGLGV
jgi:hypothetical protein